MIRKRRVKGEEVFKFYSNICLQFGAQVAATYKLYGGSLTIEPHGPPVRGRGGMGRSRLAELRFGSTRHEVWKSGAFAFVELIE